MVGEAGGDLFAYFVSGDHADPEQLVVALSEGPDPLRRVLLRLDGRGGERSLRAGSDAGGSDWVMT
ncbi:MAG TPA: hypothetical protein VFY84_03915 [Jiangellales bacterium]|nr:hypothetical protein [Jiangellales bacterium]